MTVQRGLAQSSALAVGCLASYYLAGYVGDGLPSLSRADDMIGALWAVIATVFVLRPAFEDSVKAAARRGGATAFSFVLCFAYLLFFPFHPWALAALVGLGAFVLAAAGRPADAPVAGITTAVVMIAAALDPHDAVKQPLLRAGDSAVGIAVGLAVAWIASRTARKAEPARVGLGRETSKSG